MPAYVNSWDESKPAGSRDLSLGDDDIREFKRAVRERQETDHEWAEDETGNSNIGFHRKVTLVVQSGNPALATGTGVVFTKTVLGIIELFYMDGSGTVMQLTEGGVLRDSVAAKSGDWMQSSVTTARSGWTNVSASYSNKFIRINATPLSTGGADTHTHAEVGGLTASGTSGVNSPIHDSDVADAGGPGFKAFALATTTHTHSVSASVTGTTASGDSVPAYVQAVLFQKD